MKINSDLLPAESLVLGAGHILIPTNANLDNYTTVGTYECSTGAISATITNNPYPTGAFKLTVEKTLINTGGDRLLQILKGTGSTWEFRRYQSSLHWGQWELISAPRNVYTNSQDYTFSSNYINTRIYNIGTHYSTKLTLGNLKGATAGSTGYYYADVVIPAGCFGMYAIYADRIADSNGAQFTIMNNACYDNSNSGSDYTRRVYVNYHIPKAVTDSKDVYVYLYTYYLYFGRGAGYTPPAS